MRQYHAMETVVTVITGVRRLSSLCVYLDFPCRLQSRCHISLRRTLGLSSRSILQLRFQRPRTARHMNQIIRIKYMRHRSADSGASIKGSCWGRRQVSEVKVNVSKSLRVRICWKLNESQLFAFRYQTKQAYLQVRTLARTHRRALFNLQVTDYKRICLIVMRGHV